MKLNDIANITVGQIMTRVTSENSEGIQVKVLSPKAIVEGIIEIDDLGEAILVKELDKEKYTKEGDVVIKLSTPYDAAYITQENVGLVIPSFCAAIRLTEGCKIDAKYLSAFLNTNYVRKQLSEKANAAPRPMLKITDVRALDIPLIPTQDMIDIGKAYMLSGQKKNILKRMIAEESSLMENIVLKRIKEGFDNE